MEVGLLIATAVFARLAWGKLSIAHSLHVERPFHPHAISKAGEAAVFSVLVVLFAAEAFQLWHFRRLIMFPGAALLVAGLVAYEWPWLRIFTPSAALPAVLFACLAFFVLFLVWSPQSDAPATYSFDPAGASVDVVKLR